MLVEAPRRQALASAVKGLSVRLAKGLNRMMKRTGRVVGDRYHAHVLRTPTEVRHAKTYIRNNARQHAAARGQAYPAGYVDPYSSTCAALLGEHDLVLPTAQTWLCREGWRRRKRPS